MIDLPLVDVTINKAYRHWYNKLKIIVFISLTDSCWCNEYKIYDTYVILYIIHSVFEIIFTLIQLFIQL